MMTLFRKFKRKCKLSSEMHDRWGDVAISYPNEGSWSQWDQQPGFVARSTQSMPSESPWGTQSSYSLDRQSLSPHTEGGLRSKSSRERTVSVDSAMTMPTGHYDARLRRQSRKHEFSGPGLGISEHKLGSSGWGNSALEADKVTKERQETETEPDYTRASKSPPLSVTSRMRHNSLQSSTTNATEPTVSMPGTASSRHTSFTSSAPSVPADDPRILHSAVHQEKKQHTRRTNTKQRDSEQATRQQLVPSYEDLYG